MPIIIPIIFSISNTIDVWEAHKRVDKYLADDQRLQWLYLMKELKHASKRNSGGKV